MLLNILIAMVLIAITIAIHANAMLLALKVTGIAGFSSKLSNIMKHPVLKICIIMMIMFLASVIEVLIWAVTYLVLQTLQGFEHSFYFSMVTFTSLGYGDIVLQDRWRLLASFEAANGVIMFGWTTAVVMAVIRQIFVEAGRLKS
jgi:hypothetical protein